jgi:hypothetical protein
MGVQPNDLEVIHLTFDAIATRRVSLVMHMCLSCSTAHAELTRPPNCQGVIQWTDRPKPLTGAR